MEFEQFTISLLIRRPDAPKLDEEQAAALQDAHMAHLADLHEAGHLLAAGPIAFDDPSEELRGLSILRVDPKQARTLEEADPAVRAGLYSIKTVHWMIPRGAVSFSATRFPRSVAEAATE